MSNMRASIGGVDNQMWLGRVEDDPQFHRIVKAYLISDQYDDDGKKKSIEFEAFYSIFKRDQARQFTGGGGLKSRMRSKEGSTEVAG